MPTIPTPEAMEEDEIPEFDADKALNDKRFQDYIGRSPDGPLDTSDEAKIEEAFKRFEAVQKVTKEVSKMYSGHFSTEMGIKLDKADEDSIVEYVEKLSFEGPKEFGKLSEEVTLFVNTPKYIADREAELVELGDAAGMREEFDKLKTQKENLELVKGDLGKIGYVKQVYRFIGVLGMNVPQVLELIPGVDLGDKYHKSVDKTNKEYNKRLDARAAVLEEHGEEFSRADAVTLIEDLTGKIDKLEETLTKIDSIEETKANAEAIFKNARKEVLGKASSIDKLVKSVQLKAMTSLTDLMKAGGVANLDKAQERHETLIKKGRNESGIDPLEGFNSIGFQGETNKRLEAAITDKVVDAITNAKGGDGALTNLEKQLGAVLNREKMGSKDKKDAKAFVIKTLEDVRATIGTTDPNTGAITYANAEEKLKVSFINRIIAKTSKP